MQSHLSSSAWRSRRAARNTSFRRRGVSSLLAMLYLVIFASLALGFYAQTNMSVQVSHNERRMKEALMAAECGLQYIRYELSKTTIPALYPPLTDDQVFEEIWMDLKGNIEAGSNLENGAIVGDIVYDGDSTDGITPPYFEVPGDGNQYIRMNESGPWFRVRIMQDGRDVVVTAIGKSANTVASSVNSRAAVEVRFRAKEWPSSVFGYGMASPGAVTLSVAKLMVQGEPDQQASILSTYTGGTPLTIGNTSSTATAPTGIEGSITLMQSAPNPSYVGSHYKVGTQTTQAGINAGINRITEAPEWPSPDISVFTSYAKEMYVSGKTTYDNIWIPSGSSVTFTSTHTLRGVVYMKPGSTIVFNGAVNLQCVIVGDPGGLIATNIVRFEGNGVAKLPLSSLPYEEKFAGLHELTGTFLLAPNWDATFSGNFNSAQGSIAAGKITFTGNTTASITGTILNLGNYPLTIGGSTNLTLAKPGEDKRAGLKFSERFAPVKSSYKEIPAPKEPAPAASTGGGLLEPVLEPII